MTGPGAGERALRDLVHDVLHRTTGVAVGPHRTFFDAGITSAMLLRVHEELVGRLGRELPVTALFRYPSVAALARHLAAPEAPTGPPAAPPAPGSGTAHRRRQLRSWLRSTEGRR